MPVGRILDYLSDLVRRWLCSIWSIKIILGSMSVFEVHLPAFIENCEEMLGASNVRMVVFRVAQEHAGHRNQRFLISFVVLAQRCTRANHHIDRPPQIYETSRPNIPFFLFVHYISVRRSFLVLRVPVCTTTRMTSQHPISLVSSTKSTLWV